jgi:hypothetical protein
LYEKFPQPLNRTMDTFLSGVFTRPKSLPDFSQGFVLEIAQQKRGSVHWIQRLHGFIEQWFDLGPAGRGLVQFTHLDGDLFARLSPRFRANDINGSVARDLVKPGAQNGVRGQFGGVASEVGEDGLGDFLRELRGPDLPESGGIDQVHVPAHERGERVLRLFTAELPKQIKVVGGHIRRITAPRPTFRQTFCELDRELGIGAVHLMVPAF